MNYLRTLQYRFYNYFKKFGKIELVFFFIIMSIIYYAHSQNLFNYPAYEDDEGVYMSQAWAITSLNKLAPYTYWYDHSPLGWMILAVFSQILGGYNSFGNSINTGRVIMLIMHMVSSLMIILSVRKMTKNVWAGYAAALFFSLLPLGNYFQRRVLLDNVLMFIFSLCFYFSIDNKVTLFKAMLSGTLLGMAVMCKESGIFFVPGIVYIIFNGLDKRQKIFGLITWTGFFTSIVSLYIILSILKTELFPSSDKVSLIGTLSFQISRGNGIPFWKDGSEFKINLLQWLSNDTTSVYLIVTTLFVGIIMTAFNFRNKNWTGIMLLICGYLYFILRGKIVIEFYILPLIFIVALLFGLIYDQVIRYFSSIVVDLKIKKNIFRVGILLILLPLVFLQFVVNSKALTNDDVTPTLQAIDWIRANVDQNANIIIACTAYGDLQYPNPSFKVYKNADWFWKADFDREVREYKYKNNPENVDYILNSSGYTNYIQRGDIPFNGQVYNESQEVVKFSEATSVLKVVKNKLIIAKNTWNNFKLKYLKNGKIMNNKNEVSSSMQGYGLQMASVLNDPEAFDQIWDWTQKNMKRPSDNLFYSNFKDDKIVNQDSRSDADSDIAYGLYLGSIKFKNPTYSSQASTIVNDLWRLRVVTIGLNTVIIPSESNNKNGFEIINPSYFNPSSYRAFALINPENNWNDLAFETYQITESILNKFSIVPNWVKYNYKENKFESAVDTKGNFADDFNSEASTLFWKFNLDNKINGTEKTTKIVEKMIPFLEKDYIKNGYVYSNYNQQQLPKNINEIGAISSDAGIHSLFDLAKSKEKGGFWKAKYINKVNMKLNTIDFGNSIEEERWGLTEFTTKEGYWNDFKTEQN
jgi:endo-1,4-beta-D-glucanase Y/4-amino-4-deoxy-L-arabinose transferase-like glycosyltransferase